MEKTPNCTCTFDQAVSFLGSGVVHSKACETRLSHVIRVPGLPPPLNSFYAGMHWQARKQLADEWHKTYWLSCKAYGLKPLRTPIKVTVVQECKRLRDVDAAVVSAKFFFDALVQGGYLPNDTPEYIQELTLRTVKSKENAVVFTIVENSHLSPS